MFSSARATEVIAKNRDVNGEIRRIRAGGISNKPRQTHIHIIYIK